MTQGHRQLQSGSDLIADMARMMAEEEEEQHVDRGFMGTVGGRSGGGGHGHGVGDCMRGGTPAGPTPVTHARDHARDPRP